jgi:arsenate reductase
MTVIIWHNPRCSKSRATLALLEERGIEPDILHYLDNPPSTDDIACVLEMLGRQPRELMRTGEDAYRDQDLGDASLSDSALIEAMAATPKLIERPVVINGDKAAVGRPPESVLDIL